MSEHPKVTVDEAILAPVRAICLAYPEAVEAEAFGAPTYLGPKGWIAAWLDPDVNPDWDEIGAIIDESYRLVAPKRLVSRLTL